MDCARDLAKATEFLLAKEYCLLIADVRLSGTDSMEGLEVVSFASGLRRAPLIIVLTAYGSSGIVKDALARGARTVVQKPEALAEIAQVAIGLLSTPGSCRDHVTARSSNDG